MPDWFFRSSVCTGDGASFLTYQSADGLVGLQIASGGKKRERRVYFLWGTPDSTANFTTEAQARAALAQGLPLRRWTPQPLPLAPEEDT